VFEYGDFEIIQDCARVIILARKFTRNWESFHGINHCVIALSHPGGINSSFSAPVVIPRISSGVAKSLNLKIKNIFYFDRNFGAVSKVATRHFIHFF
jgi:hypothetical protein